MTKLLKILINSIAHFIEIAIIVIIFLAFSVRTSTFQTFVAKKATNYLAEKINSKVSIGKVDIAFFDRVYFDKLYIEDLHQDTLFYIDEFYVNFDLKEVKDLNFYVDKVKIKKARAALKKYKGEEYLNLKFLIDAFQSEDKEEKDVKFKIDFNKVEIVDSRFTFEDENEEQTPYGVDFTNLDLKNINLLANKVVIKPNSYSASFKKLSFLERSGFELEDFKSDALFDDLGLALKKTAIGTKESNINLDYFRLVIDPVTKFEDFVDKVKLESQIDKTLVSLADVAYFAPALKGMNDIVLISGSTEDPISSLKMNDIILKYGKSTEIRGDFTLPDFRNLSTENIHQKFHYLTVNIDDLENFKLPESSVIRTIEWPNALKDIHQLSLVDLRLDGRLIELSTHLATLNSSVGTVHFKDDFLIQTDTTFSFFKLTAKNQSTNQIELDNFQVDKIIKTKDFGTLNGTLSLNSVEINDRGVNVNNINGLLNKTTILDYTYDYIIFQDVNYNIKNERRGKQNSVNGNIYVRDENFDLTYNGLFSFGNLLEINAKIEIECARLDEIHPALENRGELISSMFVEAKGKDFEDFIGEIVIDSLYYEEFDQVFETHNFKGEIERNPENDKISIKSDILDAKIDGNIDYSTVAANINNQIGKVFPAFFPVIEDVEDDLTHFDYDISIKNVNNLLSIFYPDLKIAPNSSINGFYKGNQGNLELTILADYVIFKTYKINQISALQEVANEELLALIDIESVEFNDSVAYQQIHFTGIAASDGLDSQLLFNDTENSRSNIEWFTNLYPNGEFNIEIQPSYITYNNNRWDLNSSAFISYMDSCFTIDGIKLAYKNQYISANGHLSNNQKDKLYLDVMNLNLEELGDLFGNKTVLSGVTNVSGYVTTPKSNLQFHGDAVIENLYVNKTEVGVVGFSANYKDKEEKIFMFGDIFYKNLQTFRFDGSYNLKAGEDEIGEMEFDMIFNQTDIAVVNEFLDPDVINNIQGKLNGNLQLTGTLKEPLLTGIVDFDDGMFNLAILGANMFFEGEIESVKDGIYINQMPIKDQEGNTGFINGSLFHHNFKDFFYEIVVNLEDHPTKRLPTDRSKPLPVERFMVMNTTYNIDSPYYGDAYITGMVEISGYSDNLSIIVNARTRKGTKFVLPLYGPTTIEEDGFITFKKEDTHLGEEKRVDLTGIDLELNFEVTDDAEVKLIFDDKSGDEISAKGNGNITLTVDQFNELAMEGTYTVSSGSYNFVLGPYTQKFIINSGGTVQWVGDPYDAILNIQAYYKTMANLSVVMPNVIENQVSNNEEIYSYLTITGDLSNPEISFDIDAPKASESGKAIINRIRSDKDVLNQQFFSIIISKSFMPLSGQVGTAGQTSGAFLDLASSQINNLLNKFTDGYDMNVNLESDDFSGQFSGEFGLSKSFLDNRLFVSGSFGIGTRKVKGGEEDLPNQSTFIGDVRIEYLLNERGTFRMNAFNESNNNYILQSEGRGQFTQGIGISYKEDFHGTEDFKLLQFFANIFRKRENWVQIRENKKIKVPIPNEYYNQDAE